MGTKSSKSNNLKTFYAISIALQLGFLIAAPIGGFLLIGFWGDTIFNTSPFLLILGLIFGFVITIYEVYHLLTPLIGNKDDA